jgi:imidazolonepropionase
MADSGVIATLLPGTAFSLKKDYARARFMIDNGLCVALATDLNPGTFYSESISLVFALASMYMNMSTEETITALTINAAAALGRSGTIGSIDKGKKGDLVILESPSYKHIPYRTGINTVEKVIKNGVLVFTKQPC